MYQVFLSHGTEELSLLQGLVNALEQAGIGVYIAERYPWPGAYLYEQKIKPAIANSDCTLVLLTSKSATSPDVNQEIGIANTQNKPIVALVEKGVPLKGILAGREVVFFDRNNPLPALQAAYEHFQSQAMLKEKAESNRNAVLIFGSIAFFILALAAKNKN